MGLLSHLKFILFHLAGMAMFHRQFEEVAQRSKDQSWCVCFHVCGRSERVPK